jgi:hypothetical protein
MYYQFRGLGEMEKSKRVARVRALWLERTPEEKRTGNEVRAFYGWLEQNRPDLLSPGVGDTGYQHLKSDLNGLFDD